ncbi:oligomeric complex COG6-domain-containing protein [Crepidotus variabilis]|uniref:Conserved oligomeric Golgi complex subunit 6 n=1 Tax=Crepidotus variabilis TaxID=179855 RepID=A0A9P6JKP7_9AGAR|nr:oligomeric complex COG6-domain-containing protein [Crepidotus variabilis]
MATLSNPLLTPTTSGTATPTIERKPSGSYGAPSRNPVSLRLYKVLSTNFEDESTKQALRTLSDLYSTSPSKGNDYSAYALNNDIEEEVTGHEQTFSTDSSIAQPSLPNLTESLPGEVASRARKNLRRDMENQLAEGSRRFLAALSEVDSRLGELQTHVAVMRASCDEAETQLALTNESSKMLLERAGHLRDERQEVEDKKSIINLFLSRFTLNAAEVEALTSRDVSVGPRFFEAMDRTEKIREDCRVLMAGEDGSTKAGLEIMASTASNLEQGYEKILRYCSNEFRQIGRESQIEVGLILQEAVVRLRKRPELLNEAFTSLSESRQATLMSSFLAALTRGGPSGYPRPIELHAHDPMRYVGDMLAWVHQAIAAEREFLESLFGMKSDMRMVGSIRKFEKGEEEEWVRDLMDSAVGKLCVPLKVRVQQTIRSQESSIVSYKIANLLQFYLITMYRTIGENALLCKTLKEITDMSYKVFYESIEMHSQLLERAPLDPDNPSLTPPAVVLDHVHILREIMVVYQSSLAGDEHEDDITAGFNQVLDIMVDPVVTLCIAIGEQKQKVRPRWDGGVYVINCLCYLQGVLSTFDFTVKKREQIQTTIDYRVTQLTQDHTINITRDAGLLQVLETIEKNENKEPLSRVPATQTASLQRSLRQFSLWLSGIEVVHSPRLAQLAVQKLHTKIHQDALVRLSKAYRTICDEVKKPENKYEAASTLLGSERPFGQMHLLQQIFGFDESDDEESESSDDDSSSDE